MIDFLGEASRPAYAASSTTVFVAAKKVVVFVAAKKVMDAGPPAFAGACFARHDDAQHWWVNPFDTWYYIKSTMSPPRVKTHARCLETVDR